MDDNDLKRFLDTNALETRRHFDIIAEGSRHQIQAVAEGVNMNGEKIDRLDAKLEQISSDLDARITRLEVASSRWPR
jgi:hypothetical protein